MKVYVEQILTGEVFEEAYKEYQDECEGIALMAPSTNFGEGGIKGAYKNAGRRMVAKVLEEYLKRKIMRKGQS